jgi:hypothetical protein
MHFTIDDNPSDYIEGSSPELTSNEVVLERGPVAQRMIDKRTIKLTQRGTGMTHKQAVRAVKSGECWEGIVSEKNEMIRSLQVVTELAALFSNLAKEDLALSGLTPSLLRSYTDDIRYCFTGLKGIVVSGTGKPRDGGELLKFNAAVIGLNNLKSDMLRLIVPMLANLTIAQAQYKQAKEEVTNDTSN